MILAAIALVCLGCSSKQIAPGAVPSPDSNHVLVVTNSDAPGSDELGRFYADHRAIPSDHVIHIHTAPAEDISYDNYKTQVWQPIREKLTDTIGIDYIVLLKGVPLRIADLGQFSVDGQVAVAGFSNEQLNKADQNTTSGLPNPYYRSGDHFKARKFGFYLVTRLDGYTDADVKRLILDSTLARREKGPFFFDAKGGRGGGGYGEMHDSLLKAGEVLHAKGFDATTDNAADFIAPEGSLEGYASWGSNDEHFSLDKYHRLRFKPGALAETFVSTSARTFKRTEGGQSLIADLIEQGVTGVKGYVSEPYTDALARPDILFDRYTSGFNLAESFYAASPVIKWKDVVIGDPLCSPFRKG